MSRHKKEFNVTWNMKIAKHIYCILWRFSKVFILKSVHDLWGILRELHFRQNAAIDELHCYRRLRGVLSKFRSPKSNQSSNLKSMCAGVTNHENIASKKRHVFTAIFIVSYDWKWIRQFLKKYLCYNVLNYAICNKIFF